MKTSVQVYHPEDFDFLPPEERQLAADGFNVSVEAASHSTENTGSWKIPRVDQEMASELVSASIDALGINAE